MGRLVIANGVVEHDHCSLLFDLLPRCAPLHPGCCAAPTDQLTFRYVTFPLATAPQPTPLTSNQTRVYRFTPAGSVRGLILTMNYRPFCRAGCLRTAFTSNGRDERSGVRAGVHDSSQID